MKGVDATNEFVLDTAVPVLVPPQPTLHSGSTRKTKRPERTERTCISAQTRSVRLNLGVSSPSFLSLSRFLSSLSFFLSSSPSVGLSTGVQPSLSWSHIHRNERKRNGEGEREKREKECSWK